MGKKTNNEAKNIMIIIKVLFLKKISKNSYLHSQWKRKGSIIWSNYKNNRKNEKNLFL